MEQHKNANGTYNSIVALSKLSGLSQTELLSIFDEVKANRAKLNSCGYHDFVLCEENELPGLQKYRCKNCGGIVKDRDYRWHELGRRPKV